VKRDRGFTLLELLVVICVVALLFGVALDRLLRVQELGERAAMEQNVAAINSALVLKFAAYVIGGHPEKIAGELNQNPVHLLARPPQNYLGELYAPDSKSLPRAAWYFDRQSGDLIYLPERARYLSASGVRPDELHFRVALTEGRNEPGEPRELPQPFIAASPPFTWQIE